MSDDSPRVAADGGSGDGDSTGLSGRRDDGLAAATREGGPPLVAKVGITVAAALLVAVVGAVVLAPPPASSATPVPEPVTVDTGEFAVDDLGVGESPAVGEIEPPAEGEGTVVIDDTHRNEVDREDIQPLVEAFVRAGYEVEFHERANLDVALSDADAYVVIDPGVEFTDREQEAVRNFTDSGGRVVVFGEPNRISVSTTGFGGAVLSTERRAGNRLLEEYGLALRPSYVYNQEVNDGGFKNPVTSPVGPAAGAGDEVVLYTAARVVQLDDGAEVVLRAPEGSQTSATEETGAFPLGVQRGNLLAVGDATLIGNDRYNVADNEDFLTYVVEFLLSGDRVAEVEPGSGTDADAGSGSSSDSD